jgi:hypothetical protein
MGEDFEHPESGYQVQALQISSSFKNNYIV